MQKSLVTLLLQYLHKQKPKHQSFALKEIYKCQEEAQKYYLSKATDLREKELVILEKYGFTRDSWVEVLQSAHSFYFLPNEKMDAANKEIKQLVAGYEIINSPASYDNYLASLLNIACNKVKKPKVSREKINGLWHYKLIKK